VPLYRIRFSVVRTWDAEQEFNAKDEADARNRLEVDYDDWPIDYSDQITVESIELLSDGKATAAVVEEPPDVTMRRLGVARLV